MTNINIDNMIPFYPDIPPLDASLEDRIQFNKSIYTREEFYENRVPRRAPLLTPGTGDRYPQQQFLANFLSPYTPYKNILVYHEMGQGKTCAGIAVAETNKQAYFTKPTLILVKGQSGVQTFNNAILKECNHPSRYRIDDILNEARGEDGVLTPARQTELKNRAIRPYYEIEHMQAFVNRIENNQLMQKQYSDRVIIIDEIQNIRIQPEGKEDSDMGMDRMKFAKLYDTLHTFLHKVQNVKIMLLSGTPVKDQPEEIASVMNLILPLDRQLPTQEEFRKKLGRLDVKW